MNLHRLLQQRASDGKPLRVALIGAGKFGSMFLAQARRTPGIRVVAVADLSPQRARESLARAGWEAARYGARTIDEAYRGGMTCVTDDAPAAIASGAVEIVIDATGSPSAGILHASRAERCTTAARSRSSPASSATAGRWRATSGGGSMSRSPPTANT